MAPEFWKKKRSKDSKGGRANKRQNTGPGPSHTLSPWSQCLTIDYLHAHGRPRNYTISVAIPGSILKNSLTQELKTILVGQIARSLALFQVDEIVVFMDTGSEQAGDHEKGPSAFFSRLLQYAEAPPHLRKKLFPMHHDLKFAGLLPTLDAPHHMRRDDRSLYREGVVTDRPAQSGKCYVDIGLGTDVLIDHALRPGVRVTVEVHYASATGHGPPIPARAEAVSPSAPRELHGLYWGYQTRLARSLGEVFTGCPFTSPADAKQDSARTQGYDYMIGHTTESATRCPMSGPADQQRRQCCLDDPTFQLPHCKHYLLVFGGLNGLEACVEADEALTTAARDADTLFDAYWNCCPITGSRSVRTEEELLMSLSKLVPRIRSSHSS